MPPPMLFVIVVVHLEHLSGVSFTVVTVVLQELFIAELMKGAHKTALECCHKEVVYSHLGESVSVKIEQFCT